MVARDSVRIAAPLALLLSACASTPAPTSTSTPTPTSTSTSTSTPTPTSTPTSTSTSKPDAAAKQEKLVAKTLVRVTELRGIAATKEVPGKVLARDQLIARVKQHVSVEIPPEAIEREGTTLKLLGFVPNDFDYGKEMFALLESQLAGYYEPEDGTMYMAADLDGMNAEATLAHELVHALQDQHWDLKKRSKYAPGQSDRSGTLAALAEGDATSAMADYIVSRMDPSKTALDVPEEVFTEQVLGSMNSGDSAHAPHIMRTSLVAPYVDGLLFVNALRRRGGWAAVNQAWDEMPKTTEQILHMSKWLAKEPALTVARPTAATLGADWSAVDEDTYGEQQMRLMFEEWMGRDEAKTTASGWGGDRGAIWTSGGKTALVVHVRYDLAPGGGAKGDAFAERAFTAVSSGFAKLGTAKKEGNFLCVARTELGPLAVRREGRELVIVAGPTTVSPKPVPAGDCALAKAWTKEVAGNP